MTTTAAETRTPIRTPDQRLRVFVSSTLRELAPERKVARAAIERIGAAPVLFELGARPHPPRELYRAYLEQSDIFVGLYADRYGWVAPGETVSGLEDEYSLAPASMPRLIYLKDTPGPREERLLSLLERVKSDDQASFKYFSGADELGDLLVADLAVLLAERFDQSRAAPPPPNPATAPPVPSGSPPGAAVPSLPAPLTELYGRADDIARVAGMLREPSVRLVTLLGAGGIGKTRLSIEVARALAPVFPDGVSFVPLAGIEDARMVPDAVAQALGLADAGDMPPRAGVPLALGDRRSLIVLDNFEQVLAAAPFVTEVLERAPNLKLVVTSRALLRVSGEHAVEVPPLGLPEHRAGPPEPGAPTSPSVALLVDRARSVKPDFELTAENIEAVEAISALLEGVPLALELAAARLRLLTPAALLDRLDRSLALLVGGQRDLPPRQRAVRSTIEWSTRLLEPDERDLLWCLGVFSGPFSLEAVESVAPAGIDALSLLETLVDTSLVRQQDRGARSCFLLLRTLREYAIEQLEREGRLDELRQRHAQHYLRWARAARAGLMGPGQWKQVSVLADERDDLRAAGRYLLESRRWDDAADLTWSIVPYWWMDGLLSEVHGWMDTIARSGDPLSDPTRAIVLGFGFTAFFWRVPSGDVLAGLAESADLFEKLGRPADAGMVLTSLASAYLGTDPVDETRVEATIERGLRLFRAAENRWGEAFLLLAKGRLAARRGDRPGAIAALEEGLRRADEQHDFLARSMALTNLGWTRMRSGAFETAAELLSQALQEAIGQGSDQSIAWGLEAFAAMAGLRGDARRAGILAGFSEALRERIGLLEQADGIGPVLGPIRAGDDGPTFEENRVRGRALAPQEAITIAEQVAAAAIRAAAEGSTASTGSRTT